MRIVISGGTGQLGTLLGLAGPVNVAALLATGFRFDYPDWIEAAADLVGSK